MDKYDVAAAVAFAIQGEPLEFENTTKHILAQKVEDAIASKREELASTIFGGQPEAEPEEAPAEEPADENEAEEQTQDEEPSEE
jgi:hypothetical protein